MKTAIKVFAIIGIILGGFALIACVDEFDPASFIGGALFLGWGITDLSFLDSLKNKK
jgi:hypothetical protein